MAYADVIALDAPDHYLPLDSLPSGGAYTTGSSMTLADGGIQTEQSARFDGRMSNLNEFISITGLLAPAGTPDMTAEFWMRGTVHNSAARVVHMNLSYNTILSVQLSNTGIPIGHYGHTSGYTSIVGTTVVQDGQWHHIAFASVAGITYLYVDGVLEATADRVTSTTNYGAATLFIGQLGTGNNALPNGSLNTIYEGQLSQFAFYDGKALSAERVMAHYNAGMAAPAESASLTADMATVTFMGLSAMLETVDIIEAIVLNAPMGQAGFMALAADLSLVTPLMVLNAPVARAEFEGMGASLFISEAAAQPFELLAAVAYSSWVGLGAVLTQETRAIIEWELSATMPRAMQMVKMQDNAVEITMPTKSVWTKIKEEM